MQLFKIAWRNLNRNPVRTAIAVLAITTVVIIVVFARGLMVGLTESSFGMYMDNHFGHVRLAQEEYLKRETLLPLDYTVDGLEGAGADEMITEIEKLERVQQVLPRISFGAMVSIDDELLRMVGVGVDPEREQQHGGVAGDVIEGRMPASGNEILVGKGLLERMDADMGDRITLLFSDAYQSLRGRTFEVVGIREAGTAALDNSFFYLPLNTAREMLWLEDEVTDLLIFASGAGEAPALQADLEEFLTGGGADQYSVVVWNQADPFVEFYYEVAGVMDLVYVLFILMGAIVIISALTMIVRERTAEIGMMGALGLRGRDIMKVFFLEGTLMGILGSLLGVIIGGVITFHYSRAGLYVEDFAVLSEDLELLIEPAFYLAFDLENLVVSLALGIIVVALSCLYPAFKAARMEPVQALHHVEE